MNKYYTTIGLEIHAELATESKMFCGCKNNPDEENPNVNICPVCTAQPGALPVPNKRAIESMIKVGLAVGGTIANFTQFDRKSYFYPDIPKGYQISQYKDPIVSGGELAGVKLTRIHLEEDTGISQHKNDPDALVGAGYSLIDYNRAGVPLLELVTEPVIHDPETAGKFGREFQLLLQTLGVAHANMEKGELRVELNISVSADPEKMGTKVEVKNINSFSAMMRAAKFEVERMSGLLEDGRGSEIIQETRGWDESKGITFSQRKKESSHDYRYFPDPDLRPMYLHELFDLEKMRAELPELPWQKRERLVKYGIKSEDADIFAGDSMLMDQFESTLSCFSHPYDSKIAVIISNIVISDLQAIRRKDPNSPLIQATELAVLVQYFADGKISSRIVKDLVPRLVYDRINVAEVLEKENLMQQNDEGALRTIAQKVIDANPAVVETYKSGKENAIMSLVGQIMRETKGSANPQLIQKILKGLLM